MKPTTREASKFEIELGSGEILDRLEKGLIHKGWNRLLHNGPELLLRYKVKSTFGPCGEIIHIQISEINPTQSLVEIRSKPHLLNNIFKRGNDKRNINKVKAVFNIMI
ncbi:hypothetical protein [Flagellimonas sediminis]|uniref:Uncharacterized protein n=1 Tax=Flagellimonas sediminis TaxID=2696468 RepID=A0A6I5KTF7_9FLAO|nr:hypothetical protein [Allomuricauda sediminis]NDV43743.1 hypothetical protein [Allomuricauda sediminis]